MTRRKLLLLSAAAAVLLIPQFVFAHGGMRELKGTIAKISSTSIVVTHMDGTTSEAVTLTRATMYKVGSSAGTPADMRVGSRVVVHFGHDGTALEIHLPPKTSS